MEDLGRSGCPGGERVAELYERVWSAVSDLAARHEGETICLATHATPIRAICARALGHPAEEMALVPWVSNASVSIFEYENGTLLVDFYTYTETGSRNSADYVRPETAPRHHKIPKDGFLRVEHLGFCDEVFLNGFFCAYVRTSTEGIYAYQFDFEEIDVLILITYDPENTGVFGLGDRAYFGGKNLEEKNGGLSACLAADASTFLYTETVNGIPVGFFRDGFSADRWHCRIDVDSFLIEIILIGETPSSEDPALSKAVALFDESQYQSAIWEIVSSVRQSKTSSPESDTNDEGLIGSNS
jgi:hypothetical protein